MRAAVLLVLLGCGPAQDNTFDTSKSTLHVALGNRSALIDPLDVRLTIDDAPIYSGDVPAGDGTQWREATVVLARGMHTVKATTTKGRVTWSGAFTMPEKTTWGILTYGEVGTSGTGQSHFAWSLSSSAPTL